MKRIESRQPARRRPAALILVCLVLFSVLLALPLPVLASDGVVEINQTRALAGGVTPGDAPGFPVTLSQSGSYILTSRLDLPDSNTNGVEIDATDVVLDLNGFSISGANVCSPATGPVTSCSASGTGIGILSIRQRISVSNGPIVGMGSKGIDLSAGGGARLERVSASHCGSIGLHLPGAAIVGAGGAGLNLGSGIVAGPAAQITGVISTANGADGIVAGDGSRVERVTSSANGQRGIAIGSAGSLLYSIANLNGTTGLDIGVGSTVIGNHASGNPVGIQFPSIGFAASWSQNTIQGSSTNDVQGTASVEMGTNVCSGSTTCTPGS